MKRLIKIFLFALLFAGVIFPQNKILDLIEDGELSVKGMIFNGKTKFLVTDRGYLSVNSDDPWRDYYRMIYRDSTISNPNTLLNHKSNSNFLFFPSSEINLENYYSFPEGSKLKEYFKTDLSGKIYFIEEKASKSIPETEKK